MTSSCKMTRSSFISDIICHIKKSPGHLPAILSSLPFQRRIRSILVRSGNDGEGGNRQKNRNGLLGMSFEDSHNNYASDFALGDKHQPASMIKSLLSFSMMAKFAYHTSNADNLISSPETLRIVEVAATINNCISFAPEFPILPAQLLLFSSSFIPASLSRFRLIAGVTGHIYLHTTHG